MKASNVLKIAATLAAGCHFSEHADSKGEKNNEETLRQKTYERMMFFYEKMIEDFKDIKDDEYPKSTPNIKK